MWLLEDLLSSFVTVEKGWRPPLANFLCFDAAATAVLLEDNVTDRCDVALSIPLNVLRRCPGKKVS